MPAEAEFVFLCERMGWTLDYVRAMSPDDLALVQATLDAKDEFTAHQRFRAFEKRGQ